MHFYDAYVFESTQAHIVNCTLMIHIDDEFKVAVSAVGVVGVACIISCNASLLDEPETGKNSKLLLKCNFIIFDE